MKTDYNEIEALVNKPFINKSRDSIKVMSLAYIKKINDIDIVVCYVKNEDNIPRLVFYSENKEIFQSQKFYNLGDPIEKNVYLLSVGSEVKYGNKVFLSCVAVCFDIHTKTMNRWTDAILVRYFSTKGVPESEIKKIYNKHIHSKIYKGENNEGEDNE